MKQDRIPANIFNLLTSAFMYAREHLPASIEKRFADISPSRFLRVRAQIENLPDILRTLGEAKSLLQDISLRAEWDAFFYDDLKDTYLTHKGRLDKVISQINGILYRIS